MDVNDGGDLPETLGSCLCGCDILGGEEGVISARVADATAV